MNVKSYMKYIHYSANQRRRRRLLQALERQVVSPRIRAVLSFQHGEAMLE